MTRIIVSTFLLILICAAHVFGQEPQSFDDYKLNPYSPNNIMSFADYLREQGDFLRAASEYDRLYFIIDSSIGSDSVLFYAGTCYLKGGNANQAINRFRKLQRTYTRSDLVPAARYQMAKSQYLLNKWEEATESLTANFAILNTDNLDVRALNLLGLSLARLKHWSKAESLFCEGQLRFQWNSDHVDSLCELIRYGNNLPNKSKYKAGVLSAIVPGLGKFYSGRKTDGFFAFITVGTSAWQSIRGFQQDGNRSVKGWMFGILAIGFHVGNIYGTTISVGLYNNELEKDYFEGFESRID